MDFKVCIGTGFFKMFHRNQNWKNHLLCLNVLFFKRQKYGMNPSKPDGVHRKENFVEIIPVFSTFSKIFKKKKKKL